MQELLKDARRKKGVRSRKWVNNIRPIINELINIKYRLTGLRPIDAIKMTTVRV